MKKANFIIAALIFIYSLSYAQQFGGSTTQTGAIYRSGSIGVGVSSVPSNVNFLVHNSTNKAAVFALGTSSLVGTYGATESIAQICNQNSKRSRVNLLSASSATSYLGVSLDANLSGNTGIALYATSAGNKKPFIIDMYGKNSLIINTNGQVGIGTGTVSLGTMKLAVEGTIGAREIKVTVASAWPDYVFAPTYKRKSFEELSNYLKKEQHLPFMTSAKEIEAEGWQSVGKTQQDMLRSLEELYLYVLDLKEENKELKNELLTLKNNTVK